MSEPMKQAWNDVEEGFSTLGRMMKEHYQGADERATADAGTARGGSDQAGVALRAAFERLVAAGRELGDRAADVARDDEVKAQARRAAASLNDALSATVDLIGNEVGGLFKRPKHDDSTPEVAAPAPTSATDEPEP